MKKYQLGMIGLGTMGKNLILNMGDHDICVVGYDKNKVMVSRLNKETGKGNVLGVGGMKKFIESLEKPRNIMLMVPAGNPVDVVIHDLLDYLDPGDLIIDGGNSHFKDTGLRQKILGGKGLLYLGVGVSGGGDGARHGPSIMPGGSPEAYQRVEAIFEAIAAKVLGESCVTYLGSGASGHYVKMVHNGIEYGLMQLIAETYDLMKRGLNLSDGKLQLIYQAWNHTEVSSYLIEITARIFSARDEKTGKLLIDAILDEASQKGTGKWASEDAMELQVPVPNIDAAVAMRNMSTLKDQRVLANQILGTVNSRFNGNQEQFIDTLRMALYAAMIITFAQGMSQLRSASEAYKYNINLGSVARIWRGGCIIRAALLNEIRSAYIRQPDLPNLLLDPQLGSDVMRLRENLLLVIHNAVDIGLPTPGFMAALSYLEAYRSSWLPANLIQAQRDYFGAHTFERIDEKGVYHTHWENISGETDVY